MVENNVGQKTKEVATTSFGQPITESNKVDTFASKSSHLNLNSNQTLCDEKSEPSPKRRKTTTKSDFVNNDTSDGADNDDENFDNEFYHSIQSSIANQMKKFSAKSLSRIAELDE